MSRSVAKSITWVSHSVLESLETQFCVVVSRTVRGETNGIAIAIQICLTL